MKLPPFPRWNKVTDDLDSSDLLRRIQDYERSQLPNTIIFPRAGQVWETVRDCEVGVFPCIIYPRQRVAKLQLLNGLTVTMADAASLPVRFFCKRARLQKGERLRVIDLCEGARPLMVHLRPVRYDELHESIVPAQLRAAVGYTGYTLLLRTARPSVCMFPDTVYLNDDFKLVEEAR